MTSRHEPGLRGQVAVIAGDRPEVVPICRGLLDRGVNLLVVAPNRVWVNEAVAAVIDPALTVVPLTADPASAEVWDRLVPHAEQRLGPIDIAVAIGDHTVRDLAHERLIGDMLRRRHGVFVEIDDDPQPRRLPDSITYACLPRRIEDLAMQVVQVARG